MTPTTAGKHPTMPTVERTMSDVILNPPFTQPPPSNPASQPDPVFIRNPPSPANCMANNMEEAAVITADYISCWFIY